MSSNLLSAPLFGLEHVSPKEREPEVMLKLHESPILIEGGKVKTIFGLSVPVATRGLSK